LWECPDDLAIQLILGGTDRLAELATALAQLGRRAGDAGHSEAAHIAGALYPDLIRDLNFAGRHQSQYRGFAPCSSIFTGDRTCVHSQKQGIFR